jgi:hypothetical protein
MIGTTRFGITSRNIIDQRDSPSERAASMNSRSRIAST